MDIFYIISRNQIVVFFVFFTRNVSVSLFCYITNFLIISHDEMNILHYNYIQTSLFFIVAAIN